MYNKLLETVSKNKKKKKSEPFKLSHGSWWFTVLHKQLLMQRWGMQKTVTARFEGVGKELTEEASQNSGAFKVKSNKSLIVSDRGAADKMESHCSSETKSPAPVPSQCSSDWCGFEVKLFWPWIFNRVQMHGWSLTRELLQVSFLWLTQAAKKKPQKKTKEKKRYQRVIRCPFPSGS